MYELLTIVGDDHVYHTYNYVMSFSFTDASHMKKQYVIKYVLGDQIVVLLCN